MASIELLRRSLARRGWLGDEEHGLLIAVSALMAAWHEGRRDER